MKKFNKVLSLLLAFAMTLTMLPASAMAVVNEYDAETNDKYIEGVPAGDRDLMQSLRDNSPKKGADEIGGVTITEDKNPSVTLNKGDSADQLVAGYKQDEIVRVIVVLEGASLLEQGFRTAEIAANGDKVQQQVSVMRAMQDTLVADINGLVQSMMPETYTDEIKATYNYSVTMNGVAVEVPYGVLEEVKELDNVRTAYIVPQYSVPEDMTNNGTATPDMITTQKLAGSALAWDAGFTGAGMRIAIIDTGLDIDHPSFVDDVPLTETSLTIAEIDTVLENLNAYKRYAGLSAAALYNSTKVPYRFNYVDHDLDVTHDNDSAGDHGTHVAGIAAANKIETTDVVGVAPEAQLLIMKVFGKNGGAYWDDIVAAIEDCYWLNVDSINMSLGSPSGFAWESDELTLQFVEVMARIEKSDMIASVSAGNSYSAGCSNYWYELIVGAGLASYFPELIPGHNQTSDPANGVVSSPATFIGATVVAALENNTTAAEILVANDGQGGEDFIFAFGDNGTYFTYYLGGYGDFQKHEYEYVMVPGLGYVEDFEQVDVEGKIAVVQRGEIAFTEKETNAYNAGAVGCIIYDNVEAAMFYAQSAGLIPTVTITLADGLKLKELAGEDGIGTMIVRYNNVVIAENADAGKMCDFSSWGVTPDLRLVPDITAYGGNIYSCYTDGEYGIMSGTSMSAPHIAGMSALILQYLRGSDYAVLKSDGDYHLVAEALLMSTAVPVTEPSGVLYSPRKQGAGNADIYKAITSPVYLTVNGGEPSVSFGDDAEKTGVYTFSFEFNNLTGEAQTYALDTTVLTDQFHEAFYELTGGENGGVKLMGETSRKLDAQVYINGRVGMQLNYNGDSEVNRTDVVAFLTDLVFDRCVYNAGFDFNEDGVLNTADAQAMYNAILKGQTVRQPEVVVPANGTATVEVKIVLSDADKAYMDANYPNGIYVDGFVRAYAKSANAVDLSLPFMGFYGDWSQARVFDTYSWYHEGMLLPERYASILWIDSSTGIGAGGNPYATTLANFDPNYEAEIVDPMISPNGDGNYDFIDDIYLSLMRNAMLIEFIWSDEDGNVLLQRNAEYARQSSYQSGYGSIIPFVYSWWFADIYDFTDAEGNYLPSGSKVNLDINFYLDDGLAHESIEEAVKDRQPDDHTSATITIDTVYPTLGDGEYIYDEKTNTRNLKFTVSDDFDVATVAVLTRMGGVAQMIKPSEKNSVVNEDGSYTVVFDVTEMDDEFILVVGDYAGNERYYNVEFADGTNHVRENAFYGYRQMINYNAGNGYIYLLDSYNGFHSFAADDATSMMMHTSMYSDHETAVVAAEYVDGYVIAIDENNQIFAMKAGDWTRIPVGKFSMSYPYYAGPVLDMAYDFANNVMYVLTDEMYSGYGGVLATIDLLTGAVTPKAKIVMPKDHPGQLLTLACDNDGVLYSVSYVAGAQTGDEYAGDLYTLNIADIVESNSRWTANTLTPVYVGETGYIPEYRQSMTVDHDTNELYWMAYASPYAADPATFFQVNKTTGELTVISDVEYESWMTAIYKPYTKCKDILPAAELEGINLDKATVSLSAGAATVVTATPYPYYASLGEPEWTSSDESVAVVMDGMIIALGEGRAEVTITSGEVSATCVVDVVNLHADLTFYEWGNEALWMTMNASKPGAATVIEDAITPASPYNGFMAAAYFDGWLYAYESGGAFYRIDPETMQGTLLGSAGANIFSMAFNYADGFMYAVEEKMTSMWGGATYNLHRVNLNTGALEFVAEISAVTPLGGIAIDYNGVFHTFGPDMDTYSPQVVSWMVGQNPITGESGIQYVNMVYMPIETLQNYTSMTYSAEDNGLYISDNVGQLYWIDLEYLYAGEARYVNVGAIGNLMSDYGYAMNMAMFTIPETEPETPDVDVTNVTASKSMMLLEGGSATFTVTVEPWNAYPKITYSVADESIATVDTNGVVTGISAGTTTLYAKVEGVDAMIEATITVSESTGYINGYLLDDLNGGGYVFAQFADTDPAYDLQAFYSDDRFSVFAGTYFDGTIYAYGQDQYGDLGYYYYFLKIDPYTYEMTEIARVAYNLRDMAFDYTTGNLYTIAQGGTLTGAVAQLDMETGELTVIAETGIRFVAMTIDAEGQMYGIGEDDYLYAINKYTGKIEKIGYTGVDAGALYQSMHYDLDTGNVYWAQIAGDQTSSLRLVDLKTGVTCGIGTISPVGAMMTCLYTVPENEPTEPKDEVKEAGIIITEKATTHVGGTVQLDATILTEVELKPADATTNGLGSSEGMTILWSSSDKSIATVDANGVVTGIAPGTVTITAQVGNYTATSTVVITAEARKFYAYDKSNNQWISSDGETVDKLGNLAVEVERKCGDETLLQANYYVYDNDTVYGVDEMGMVYSISADTFVRQNIVAELSTTYTTYTQEYDWEWDEYYDVPVECELKVVDMAYSEGKLYVAMIASNEEAWVEMAVIATVDLETGEVEYIFESGEIQPGNIYVKGNRVFMVDTWFSGMINYLDLDSENPKVVQDVLIKQYWGDSFAGAAMFEDELTGVIYAIRDNTDTTGSYDENWNYIPWDGVTGDSVLYIMGLSDGSIVRVGEIGNNIVVRGMFIR